ncbi:MAG: hypothetical protein JXQ72_00370 [Anaerolineae bacterium]|nr:hypothetical protein [Anaerolineae bacterium]
MRVIGIVLAGILAGVLALALTGCTLVESGESPSAAQITRDELAAQVAIAQESRAAALALWDRIIFGEMVSCEDAIFVPELLATQPGESPEAAAIREQLNAAIRSLHDSADLWNIECNEVRFYVPLDMARAGRAAALAASEPLDQAAAQLAAWGD